MDKNQCKICIVDSFKMITKEGYTNLCSDYGEIKQIIIHKYADENKAFIEYANKESVKQFLKEQSNLPSFLKVIFSNEINLNDFDNEDIEKFKVTGNQETINNANKEDIVNDSTYFGPMVFGSDILQESKQLKLIDDQKKLYNLRNDDLFGKPLNTKWEKIEKLEFQLHNIDYCRFENCFGGEIKVGKKLSPHMFTGWPTLFDGQNVQDKLKDISNDIESSELLNIDSLERGMLVGAFDIATNSYARGYVVLISGNSVNVAMSDYGRVINTIQIRALPEKLTQLPAYSFKVFTKDNCVSKLKEKLIFKVCSASINRIKLIVFDENKEFQVQLKKWTPTVEESGVPYIELKNNSDVVLLNLKDMNSVHLRSKKLDDIDIFFSIWNSVVAYCEKNSHSLKREPYYGEIIGFKSIITTNYERGRIHKYLGDNIYYVKHMHHPIKEYIELSEIIELQFEQKCMPVSFITVGLKNSLPYPIINDAKGFVECLKDTRLVVNFDESSVEGWKCLDLTIKYIKENVNQILYGLVEPSWFKNTSTDIADNIYYKNLLKMNLKKKSVVHMKFVMYHSGVYYMRDKSFGKSFSLLSSMIKEYSGLNLHPYLPHINEICLGQFPDGMWYRVVCNEQIPGHLTGVHAVDLGNVALLKSTHMKEMPVELLFHPMHVYRCILTPSINIDANKLKILQQYENTDCEVTIVNNDEHYYLIKCPFIENILC